MKNLLRYLMVFALLIGSNIIPAMAQGQMPAIPVDKNVRIGQLENGLTYYIRHNARSYIFSASNTPAATAAAIEALHIMKAEPERLTNLCDVTNYALKNFRELGFEIGATSTPIIPIYIRDTDKTFMVTKMLWDAGIFINPVVPPACSPQDTLIRFSLMATHTKEQVDRALEKMVEVFKALDLLK